MTRKGVFKAVKKPIPEEYNRLPNIFPVQSSYHTLVPSVKNEVNNLPHYSAYHLWLDCLYETDVTYESILDGLKPLLDTAKRRTIKIRNIFIRGHRFDDGSYKPDGSCYLMIPDALRGQSKNRDFDLDILDSKIHMSMVETEVLLRQLNRHPTLVLTEGFKEQLAQINIDDLSKVCKLNAPIPAPRAAQPTVVDQQPKSKKQAGDKQVANKATPSQPAPSQPSSERPSVSSQSINASVENIARLLQQSSIDSQQLSSNGLPNQQNGLNTKQPSVVQKTKVYKASNGVSSDKTFEAKLMRDVEEREKRSEFVSTILPTLHKFGDTVIKIENLPAKLTVHALNLMMGTYSLTSDQIVATVIPGEKGQLMNIRVIMQSANQDLQRIVSKNRWKTSYDTLLLIKRTDLKELEAFLNDNYDKIYKLETSDKLPVNSIGYGKLQTN